MLVLFRSVQDSLGQAYIELHFIVRKRTEKFHLVEDFTFCQAGCWVTLWPKMPPDVWCPVDQLDMLMPIPCFKPEICCSPGTPKVFHLSRGYGLEAGWLERESLGPSPCFTSRHVVFLIFHVITPSSIILGKPPLKRNIIILGERKVSIKTVFKLDTLICYKSCGDGTVAWGLFFLNRKKIFSTHPFIH